MADQITPEMVNAILFDIGTHDPCDEEMEETICRNILRAALAAGWLPPPTEDVVERVAKSLCWQDGCKFTSCLKASACSDLANECWIAWLPPALAVVTALRGEKK